MRPVKKPEEESTDQRGEMPTVSKALMVVSVLLGGAIALLTATQLAGTEPDLASFLFTQSFSNFLTVACIFCAAGSILIWVEELGKNKE